MQIFNSIQNKYVDMGYREFCFDYCPKDILFKQKRLSSIRCGRIRFAPCIRKRKKKNKSFWKNFAFKIICDCRKKKAKSQKEVKKLKEELAYHFSCLPVRDDFACITAKTRLILVLDELMIADSRPKKPRDKIRRSIHLRDFGRIYQKKYWDAPDVFGHKFRPKFMVTGKRLYVR